MTILDLIKLLQKVEDKTLPINVLIDNNDLANNWVYDIKIMNTNDSGYEVEGEVILLTSQ